MKNVTVRKEQLLEALQRNRGEHQAIFEEALAGYKEEVIKQLEAHLAAVKAGKVKRVQVYLPTPENHTKDYDRIIAMVEMSVEDELVLDQQSFAQYVLDDWTWKRQFLTTNSAYSATATRSLGSDDESDEW